MASYPPPPYLSDERVGLNQIVNREIGLERVSGSEGESALDRDGDGGGERVARVARVDAPSGRQSEAADIAGARAQEAMRPRCPQDR